MYIFREIVVASFYFCKLSWLLQTPMVGEEEFRQKAKSRGDHTYLLPGIVGALPCLCCPAHALEGQDHVSSAGRVKHWVSRWDVDVEELSRAARFLRLQDVQEHMET